MTLLDVALAGPRPLKRGEPLVGRDRLLGLLSDACATSDIITLTAFSGVGKTSFVQAGLIPRLEDEGYFRVYPASKADGEASGWPTILSYLGQLESRPPIERSAEIAYRLLVGLDPESEGSIQEEMRADMRPYRRAVVVLDQFEELLRSYSALGDELLRLVARIGPKIGTHIVVARSEYRERLRPLQDGPPLAMRAETLDELTEDVLPEVFRKPFAKAGVAVDDGVVDRLVQWWIDARASAGAARLRQVGTEGLAEVGLLQFQATAHTFVEWLQREWDGELADRGYPEDRLTDQMLDDYVAHRAVRRGSDASSAGGDWVMRDGLVTYVRRRMTDLLQEDLERPAGPTGTTDPEPLWWSQGPSLMMARVAPAFTLGGFKQPRSLYALLAHALEGELSTGAATVLGERIAENPKLIEARLRSAGKRVAPAGIALVEKRSGADVIAEMVDSLHAALRHLSEGDINVLRSLEEHGEPVFELVHDGMGEALRAWSKGYLARPLAQLGVIGAQTSAYVAEIDVAPAMIDEAGLPLNVWGAARWAEPQERPSFANGEDRYLVLEGLAFPSAALVDCSFTNVIFHRCTFTGASFVNCALENVAFDDCNLKATVFLGIPPDDDEDEELLPGDAAASEATPAEPRVSKLKNVVFRNRPPAEGDEPLRDNLDLLTVKNPAQADHVSLEHVELVTGLFWQGVPSGTWKIADSTVIHLAFSGAAGIDEDAQPVLTVDPEARVHGATLVDVLLDDKKVNLTEIRLPER